MLRSPTSRMGGAQNPREERAPAGREGPLGRGGMAASVEAAAKTRTQPPGKGIAMVVLAVAVLAAIVFDMVRRSSTPPPARADAPPMTAAEDAGTEAATIDARFDLPGALPADVGRDLAVALTRMTSDDEATRYRGSSAVAGAFQKVPADLREETRARLLAHLASIGDRPSTRSAALAAGNALIGGLPRAQLPAARRLNLIAELALSQPDAVVNALVYLSKLPASARPGDAIAQVVMDTSHPEVIRTRAVHALPTTRRHELAKKLADDPAVPQAVREALQADSPSTSR